MIARGVTSHLLVYFYCELVCFERSGVKVMRISAFINVCELVSIYM